VIVCKEVWMMLYPKERTTSAYGFYQYFETPEQNKKLITEILDSAHFNRDVQKIEY
jgi:hypothetical protein